MRKVLIIATLVCLTSLNAAAQGWTFARDSVEYVVDLPTPTWRVVSRVDVHEHVEFVNGNNEVDGYLRLTRIWSVQTRLPLTCFKRMRSGTFRFYPVA